MSDGNNYTENLNNIKKALEDFASEFRGDILEIKNALLGTKFGDEGLVKRFNKQTEEIKDLKEEIQELKTFRTKLIGISIGLGASSGTLSAVLLKFFTS